MKPNPIKPLLLLACLVLLAACPAPEPVPDFGLAGFDPDMVENRRTACEARGGRFGAGGLSGAFVCFENTSDANKSCTSGKQCESICLARSGTCAPSKPMFGCNEVFGNSGIRSTVCIN